jgi:S-adenosylmethionine synthetase
MEIVISDHDRPSVEDRKVEIVERKGLGHPDTICDALAEQFSVALSRFYLQKFDLILHHNVDKVLLRGGVSQPAFGGGRVISPIEVFFAGRATTSFAGITVPVEELAVEACRKWFRDHFHALDAEAQIRVHCLIHPGSAELVDLYMRQQRTGLWLANDTSCGLGYAPLSTLERVVLEIENHLNAASTKAAHPQIGEDVKVMGIRNGQRIGLTVACAMVGRYLVDLHAYLDAKGVVADLAREAAQPIAHRGICTAVNTADDPTTENVYLTVSGTSAEGGDDGGTGRGNRTNGLIAPFRPMTLEAAAGKNAITHVGKLYNIAASAIATTLVDELSTVIEADCVLVSRIGQPVVEPQIVNIVVRTANGQPVDANIASGIREIAQRKLNDIPTLWRDVIAGAVSLY